MSLHKDLLDQARSLACEPHEKADKRGRPKQANLRRSVSTSYYALFHRLTNDATKLMMKGRFSRLRHFLARAFDHKIMKEAAEAFAININSNNQKERFLTKFKYVLKVKEGECISKELIEIASIFCELQESRHNADYNLALRLTRNEARALADKVERAFENLDCLKDTDEIAVFLASLLIYNKRKSNNERLNFNVTARKNSLRESR